MISLATELTKMLSIELPVIGGAMYPCSNPELVAAVSEAGGIGVLQPLSLVYVFGYEFASGLKRIRELSAKPIGMNVIVEKGSKLYEQRMQEWVRIALDQGVKFFITALGNPSWVVEAAHARGALVFHDVTERKWAEKAKACGVDGLICVNNRAGGHAGSLSAEKLYSEFSDLGLPLVCAGGIGDSQDFATALKLGYAGVQIGTRFIATTECQAHESYKRAIIEAEEKDIVLTKRVTGVPLSVIRTPYVVSVGTEAGPISRILLKNPRTRHWVRLLYSINSFRNLKRSALKGLSTKDYWQAGKSVSKISAVEPVARIMQSFRSIASSS